MDANTTIVVVVGSGFEGEVVEPPWLMKELAHEAYAPGSYSLTTAVQQEARTRA